MNDADKILKLQSETSLTDDTFKKYNDLNDLINESHDHILNGRTNQLNKTVKKMSDLSNEIKKDRQEQMDMVRLCLKILYE